MADYLGKQLLPFLAERIRSYELFKERWNPCIGQEGKRNIPSKEYDPLIGSKYFMRRDVENFYKTLFNDTLSQTITHIKGSKQW